MSTTELKPPSYIVLALVRRLGAATPYDLKRAATESIGQFWALAHSQLYAEPERLTSLGLLLETREEGGRRRKSYTVTPAGDAAYASWLADPETDTYDLRDPGLLKLALGADPKALAPVQLELHERALEAYEQTEASLPESERNSGAAHVLRAGIGHEREYVRFWAELTRP